MVKRPHLLVIDVQNDFCHPKGFFPQHFNYSTTNNKGVIEKIQSTISFCRISNIPVLYAKMNGDKLSLTQYKRYKQMQKLGFLKENSWGAELFKLNPLATELVFEKAGYDAFNNDEFKNYVSTNASELILVGFYSDVCIDATAKTADQLGIETTIIANNSTSCFRNYEESLKHMQTFYGTKIFKTLEEFQQQK